MSEKIITFGAAYDKRHSDPKKNYGIHGVDLRMVLKGKKGAMQFVLYTDWHLPHVREEHESKNSHVGPIPADVGYHSLEPQYEGQICRDCEYVEGGKCYYDGSGLQAEEVFDILTEKGSEGVWSELERRYVEMFGENP